MNQLFARSFLVFVLSLASAIPAFAEKTYRFRKLPAATLRGLAAVPAPPPLPRENRHERRDRKPRPERQRLRTEAVSTPTLVTTATIAPPPMAAGFASDSSESLSPADSSGAVSKSHVVIDSPAGTNYAYPSLAVSRNGGMLISYCVLSKTTYPSTAYVYRDPSGRLSTPGMIRTGDSPILSTDRWRDYTTVVTDPANDRDFWVAQIYASRNNWQTWWAQVTPTGRSRAARK